jgi:hypothetical protein
MPHDATTVLTLLVDRLRLGIPLAGFDGAAIPMLDGEGRVVEPIEAAEILLRTSAARLPASDAELFVERAIRRAEAVEATSVIAGEPTDAVVAKVAGVLVSAAVRADTLYRQRHASPGDLNRATLAWFRAHEHVAHQLLEAAAVTPARELTA